MLFETTPLDTLCKTMLRFNNNYKNINNLYLSSNPVIQRIDGKHNYF